MNYCEFLKERDSFSISYAKVSTLRLERENQVLFLLIQLSISNLFLKLFHQVGVKSIFSSVFVIYMEEH